MMKLARIGAASVLTGLTVKQLRHLEELGLVQPRSVGSSHRGYGQPEIEALKALKALMNRDPSFTPKRIQWVLGKGFGWQDIPELRRYMELRGKARQEVRETKDDRAILKDGQHNEQMLSVADFQAYNTAYKRLRRLADNMGLLLELRKEGGTLYVRTRGKRSDEHRPRSSELSRRTVTSARRRTSR